MLIPNAFIDPTTILFTLRNLFEEPDLESLIYIVVLLTLSFPIPTFPLRTSTNVLFLYLFSFFLPSFFPPFLSVDRLKTSVSSNQLRLLNYWAEVLVFVGYFLCSMWLILSVVSDSFFSSYPINLSSMSVEGCKRRKEGRKKGRKERDKDTVQLRTLFSGSRRSWGGGVLMVKALDCGIVVSEFELESRYYVYFRTNTLGKGINPLTRPAMGWIASWLFF